MHTLASSSMACQARPIAFARVLQAQSVSAAPAKLVKSPRLVKSYRATAAVEQGTSGQSSNQGSANPTAGQVASGPATNSQESPLHWVSPFFVAACFIIGLGMAAYCWGIQIWALMTQVPTKTFIGWMGVSLMAIAMLIAAAKTTTGSNIIRLPDNIGWAAQYAQQLEEAELAASRRRALQADTEGEIDRRLSTQRALNQERQAKQLEEINRLRAQRLGDDLNRKHVDSIYAALIAPV